MTCTRVCVCVSSSKATSHPAVRGGCGPLPSEKKRKATNITSTGMKRTWRPSLVPLDIGSAAARRAGTSRHTCVIVAEDGERWSQIPGFDQKQQSEQ